MTVRQGNPRTGGPPAPPVSQERAASPAGKRVANRSATARGARWLLLLLVSFGSVQVLFMIGVEVLRLARAEMTLTRLEREVGALEAEAQELQAVIEHREDERFREQLARRQGYMYPDESRIVTTEPR